jgi:hypothetical protein
MPTQSPDAVVQQWLHARYFEAVHERIGSDAMSRAGQTRSATLQRPEDFLTYLNQSQTRVDLAPFTLLEMWALAAVAAPARDKRDRPLEVSWDQSVSSRGFATAVGFDDVAKLVGGPVRGEQGRTVRLTLLRFEEDIDTVAKEIARLLAGTDETQASARWTLQYVVTELLRNVLQHSRDSLGGVVGAQLNDKGLNRDKPVYQVVVADTGKGIRASLARHHSHVTDDREALEIALHPHISGAFPVGRSGNEQNAGLGLFFISEMAKHSGGRMLLASQSAGLIIDPSLPKRAELLSVGYPGTLVVFESPVRMPMEFGDMFDRIAEHARERKPSRLKSEWLRFSDPPQEAMTFLVNRFAENNEKARDLSQSQIIPRLLKKQTVVLNFVNVQVATQSFIHVLLYEALRIAWASQTPIYVTNVQPFVKRALEYVQVYAQGG